MYLSLRRYSNAVVKVGLKNPSLQLSYEANFLKDCESSSEYRSLSKYGGEVNTKSNLPLYF